MAAVGEVLIMYQEEKCELGWVFFFPQLVPCRWGVPPAPGVGPAHVALASLADSHEAIAPSVQGGMESQHELGKRTFKGHLVQREGTPSTRSGSSETHPG